MCASVVNACRGEELCVKAGQAQDRLVQLGKEKHGWMRGAPLGAISTDTRWNVQTDRSKVSC